MNHARELAFGEEVFVGKRFCFITLLPSTNAAPPCGNCAPPPPPAHFLKSHRWSPHANVAGCVTSASKALPSRCRRPDGLINHKNGIQSQYIYISTYHGLTLQICYNCIDQSYLSKARKGGGGGEWCRDQKLCLVSGSKSKARSFPHDAG